MSETTAKIKSMLEQGQDPKDWLIGICDNNCVSQRNRLARCEKVLKEMESADATKSCLYPFRDWVTCVDACVQPKIQSQLVGNEKTFIWFIRQWSYFNYLIKSKSSKFTQYLLRIFLFSFEISESTW